MPDTPVHTRPKAIGSAVFPRGRLAVPGIILLGVCMGCTVYLTLSGSVSVFYSGLLFFLMLLPFIFIWHQYAKKILVAVLVLTIPLIIDKTLNLHEFHQGGAKGYIISLNDVALMLLYLILFFEMYRKRQNKISLLLLYSLPVWGILVMSLLSMINAEFRHFSIYEFIEIVKMYLAFLFIANYVRDTGDLKLIVYFLLAGLCIEVLFVFLELMTNGSFGVSILGITPVDDPYAFAYFRVGGTFGGANGLAWYLDIVLPVMLALVLSRIRSPARYIAMPALAGGIFCLLMTYSRGGWFGFILGSALVAAALYVKLSLKKKLVTGAAGAIVLVLLLSYIFGTSNPVRDRLTEDDRGSATSRLPLIELAVDIIRDNPVTGVGLNNYTEVHHKYDYGVDRITDYYPVPVHNIFLMIAAETGLPGLGFFLVFLTVIYWKGTRFFFRHEGFSANIVIGILGGITGFLIQGLVQNSSLGSINFFPFWVLSGAAAGVIEREKEQLKETKI